MAISTVKLHRSDGTPWGFRLQGGKDFATPLCVQKVNAGSLAAAAGLQAGDAIVSIGGRDALSLRHKEAQEAIVRAGNNFDLVIQRGTQVWRPQVTPLAQVKTTPEGVPVATSTSLAANKKPYVAPAGVKHNVMARPFAEVNGQQIVNAQYNTPLNLYSEDNIAETLSAQAEVLGKGCLGINFKKYDRETKLQTDSPTYKLIHGDVEAVPKPRQPACLPCNKDIEPTPEFPRLKPASSAPRPTPSQQESPASNPGSQASGYRSVRAPETKVRAPGEPSPSQATKCSECERPITGVFVRVKNKSLHADCFKCATCGSSLKNVGYYNINEKLYCDVHAKQAARHHPPAPNMDPIIVKPGATAPSGAMTTSMAKTAAPYKSPLGGMRSFPKAPAPAPAPMPKFTPIAPPKPAPIPAPAPAPIQVPAAPMAAPPPIFSPVKAPAAPAPQKAPFGAPSGGVDVRSHIPKKGGPFLWPPPKKVETDEEGPRTPSWAPAGAPSNFPKPKYIGGPPPKRPPLLPTPPPPKDYDSIVIQASPSAAAVQPPSADPKAHPLAAYASAPACSTSKLPQVSKGPHSGVTAKSAAAAAPAGGFKPVAAPKAYSNVYKPLPSSQKSGPAPGAPSVLASSNPISPPASVPIVNANMAPAPKPAAAFTSVPKPAAPKPHAPTGPAPAMPKPSPLPNLGGGGGGSMKGVAQTSGQKSAPRRGRGVMNAQTTTRIPICADCARQIRGPFVSALGKTWCPDHFICSTGTCRKALIDMGFVEEQGALHCEDCYERYLAPICGKCDKRVKGDCLNAVGKQFHPECFCCAYCGKMFGSSAFYLEDGLPYCEADWNDLFTTKCVGCGFPIEAGDRWVEALNNNYHSQCFKCSKCHKNLEGQSFFAKGGKPFCKAHAQRGF